MDVRNLMEGDDVTQQRCTDCGFRGTKKRVKIHCMQHHCKYLCECMLIKSSCDAVNDNQVSKKQATGFLSGFGLGGSATLW